MNPDELNLRHSLWTWEMRFVTGDTPNILALAKEKNQFAQKHGFAELKRIVKEVIYGCFLERQESGNTGEVVSHFTASAGDGNRLPKPHRSSNPRKRKLRRKGRRRR